MYLNDVFTVPANLAGIPGISVPAGLSKDGLPLGLQLLAGAFCEDKLYATAATLESMANFTTSAQKRQSVLQVLKSHLPKQRQCQNPVLSAGAPAEPFCNRHHNSQHLAHRCRS